MGRFHTQFDMRSVIYSSHAAFDVLHWQLCNLQNTCLGWLNTTHRSKTTGRSKNNPFHDTELLWESCWLFCYSNSPPLVDVEGSFLFSKQHATDLCPVYTHPPYLRSTLPHISIQTIITNKVPHGQFAWLNFMGRFEQYNCQTEVAKIELMYLKLMQKWL